MAFQGGLDFVNDRFDEETAALVEAKGCAKAKQKIRGTFENPMVDKPSRLASLTGACLSLLEKGSDLFGGGWCDVFYAGLGGGAGMSDLGAKPASMAISTEGLSFLMQRKPQALHMFASAQSKIEAKSRLDLVESFPGEIT